MATDLFSNFIRERMGLKDDIWWRHLKMKKQNRQLNTFTQAVEMFYLLLVLFTITGLAIYATTYDDNYYALKWSYALCWGATLCMFAALVFTIINIDRKRTD